MTMTEKPQPPHSQAPESAFHEALCRELAARSLLYQEALAERVGLNVTDHRCLELVLGNSSEGPVTAGKLSELTGLTTGAITGVLDRLERAGFVKREKDPEDRRQVQIKLVPERVSAVSALSADLSEALKSLSAKYDPAQRTAIAEFIGEAARLFREESERLRGQAAHGAAPGAQELSAPLGHVRAGRLEVSRGATNLTLSGAPGSTLYRLRHEGPAPQVQVEGGSVHVDYNRSALRMFTLRKQALQIELNDRIAWEVVLRGGADKVQADLRALSLKSLEVRGGANHVGLELPAPEGTVSVRIGGGANHLRIVRPKGTSVRIHVGGGVSHLTIDKLELGAVGGTMRWELPDYESSSDRYDIQIGGGATHLTIQ